jgi:hypothetical protein
MPNHTCSGANVESITLNVLSIIGIILTMLMYALTKYRRIFSILGIKKYDPAFETAVKVSKTMNAEEIHSILKRVESGQIALRDSIDSSRGCSNVSDRDF